MTIKQCAEAIALKDRLRFFQGALSQGNTRNFVSTEGIATGFGEKKITLQIPWSYCEHLLEDEIAFIEKRFKLMGIEGEA